MRKLPALILAVFALLLIVLSDLTACSRQSAYRYPIVANYTAKQTSSPVFAYTTDYTDSIYQAVRALVSSDEAVGALLPVYFPEHLKKPFHGKAQYWSIIRYPDDTIQQIAWVYVDCLGRVTAALSHEDLLSCLGELSSEESPLRLYRESDSFFAIIGDEAYFLTGSEMTGNCDSYCPDDFDTRVIDITRSCH